MDMATIRRLPVTLFEVLIVIAILVTVSGIVAVSINKAIVNQRFQTEVNLIADELRLAQNIMSILKTDTHVIFEEDKNKKGILYKLEMDTLLQANIQHEVQREKNNLTTVKGVFFLDELQSETVEGRLDIKFLSSGAVMSKGIIRLASSDNEKSPPPNTLESYICLVGFPYPITISDTLEEAEKICSIDNTAFDEQLTQDTMQRIPDSAKHKNNKKEKRQGNRQEKKQDKNQDMKK